jgi:hypothetical protein
VSLPLPSPFQLWSLGRNWETSWEITPCLLSHTMFGHEVQVLRNEQLVCCEVFATRTDALNAAKHERERLILEGWIVHRGEAIEAG